MEPSKPRAFGLALIAAMGLVAILYGFLAVTACPEGGGCRPEPVWPLIAAGVGLILVAGVSWGLAVRANR